MRQPVAAWVVFGTIAMEGAAFAAHPAPRTGALDVCMVASAGLPLNRRERETVAGEANEVWQPLDVRFRWVDRPDERCSRLVAVKSDAEGLPWEAADETALGWVPFVEGRARQIIFLRVTRARRLIAAINPGRRPDDLNSFFAARLLGRGLAHEMGHVLLNLRTHSEAGLMQPTIRPGDVFTARSRHLTLGAAERALLRTALDGVAPR